MIYRLIFLDNDKYKITEINDRNIVHIVNALVSLKNTQLISISLIGEDDI